MAKKTLKERLIHRKIKSPNKLITFFVSKAFWLLSKKRKVRFEYEGDVLQYRKKQIILLSQHASRDDYVYTIAGFLKYDMHCVIGYQNFMDKSVYSLLIALGSIAKYLYQPDPVAAKNMLQVLKNGESLLLFPEGIQSTSGSTHPINPATMKFLMKCRLPVVLCTSHGSYLTRPRYSTKHRTGQMTFRYRLLFSERDFAELSYEQLYARLLENFRYNEFTYNREKRIPFRGKCYNIEGLDSILYKCPHCKKEFAFTVEADTMRCECGFAVRMNEYYDLLPVEKELPFADIDEWYKWQRREVAKQVRTKGFCLQADVSAYDYDPYILKKHPDKVGDGVLTITDHLLTYRGTYKGEERELQFDIRLLPSFPFSPIDGGADFYYANNYYSFIPHGEKRQSVLWMLAVEEIHRMYGKNWDKASEEVYEC